MIYEWDPAKAAANLRRHKVSFTEAASVKKINDELRAEYDLSQLKGGVRGKYYKRATAGTNLVLIEPALAKAFPDSDSVNRASRLLLDAASSAAMPSRQRRTRLKRTA
ncbi:MAG TPA: BrnT family toxin [Patescibacteria group bacterium]|nr:BrnT family toxin [Patescibacteria group bacterium]